MSLKSKTEAREALRWFNDSNPLPTEENRATRKTLEAAAKAEFETDIVEMAKTADWLERLASEQEAAGKVHAAAENLASASDLRGKIAALTTAGASNDNVEIGEAA